MADIAIRSKHILTPQGVRAGVLVISNSRIADILPWEADVAGLTEDVGENWIIPGVIDPHVHINEPGRTDWEGFDTATKAAAAGGITSLIEMPLNASPVTTTRDNFQLKLEAAKNKIHINCGFWGGVVPDNIEQLEELLESGVFGLKAFLTHSGIDDFPNTNEEQLRQALKILKKHDKPLLAHCELDGVNADAGLLEQNPRSYQAYLKSRPRAWEDNAVKMMIDLCRETGARVHIVHLSSSNSIVQIQQAKKEGLPLTVETCPHYLFFNAEEIPDGDTRYKCAPPIREKENNELLWQAVKDGTIDFIATDHSPAPPAIKEFESGNLKKAWGGIAGLQFGLTAVWTKAKERGFTVEQISKLLSENVATFLKLDSWKGKIEKGYGADIVVWNPGAKFKVETSAIQHRHKITPYQNLVLTGVVEQTYVNGKKVYDNGKFIDLTEGKILLQY